MISAKQKNIYVRGMPIFSRIQFVLEAAPIPIVRVDGFLLTTG